MTNVPNKRLDISLLNKSKDDFKNNKGKGAQCSKCEGFGHIKVESPTFLKKRKERLSITWYEFDGESEKEITIRVMTFTGKLDFCSETSNKEMSVEELAEIYREILIEWKDSHYKRKEDHKCYTPQKEKLGSTITSLKEEFTLLKSKLENMREFIHMKNNSTDMLNDVLEENMKVVGFDYSFMNKKIKVPPKKKTEFWMVDHMSQHRARHVYPKHRGNKTSKDMSPLW